ncbi:DUF397 domain-containing protein [Streptomyces olivoreticuli]|uniref:DUF397 domain-containing protein n=1 Tax=Streptomyces olivoreticuli TaxID=68246 RepID=UPI0026595457|nr:DUF397 domain-containing protein [Streptomyces olivoreticuli]WKK26624.1 DUF397 domain-containing protein [Streptomyces olivoreticuli]
MTTHNWQKSSYSGDASNCLNIAATDDSTLLLRESDNPTSILSPSAAKLGALISAVKGNRFSREGCP